MTAASWTDRARCAGDADAARLLENTTDESRRYCLGCPVLEVCLAAALVEELGASRAMRHGVRGGHSPTERRRLEAVLPSVRANLRRALELDAAGQLAPVPWPPPALKVRRRLCAAPGCRVLIEQPAAGRPKLVCSTRCANRRWYARHAERERAAARARFAELSPAARAQRVADARARRARARTLPAMAETG